MTNQIYIVTCRDIEYPLFLTKDYDVARKICDIHNKNVDFEMNISIIDCIGGVLNNHEYNFPHDYDFPQRFKPFEKLHFSNENLDISKNIENKKEILNFYYFKMNINYYFDEEISREDKLFYDDVFSGYDTQDNDHYIISVGKNKREAAHNLDHSIDYEKWKTSYIIKKLEKKFYYFLLTVQHNKNLPHYLFHVMYSVLHLYCPYT